VISSTAQKRTLPATGSRRRRRSHWYSAWLLLVLACMASGWFAYQYFLAPQPPLFAADWQGARWVKAADGNTPVAYFRDVIDLDSVPVADSVTIAASQVFRLYVNGAFIGTNSADFTNGMGLRTYLYDVASALHSGTNVIGVRVAHLDQQAPSLRLNLVMDNGASRLYSSTGPGWQATSQSSLVYLSYAPATASLGWTKSTFDASSWQPVKAAPAAPSVGALNVNPALYAQPLSSHWINAGPGGEAYFVRTITAPLQMRDAWLRIAATGPASIFINGKLDMAWNGEAPLPQPPLADYISDQATVVQYEKGLVVGIYNISPYLHPGTNVIAVHVTAPGLSAAGVGLSTLGAALSLDVLSDNLHGQNDWFGVNQGWHASAHPLVGWERGSRQALAWPSPGFVNRPGVSREVYLPNSATPRDAHIFPFTYIVEVAVASVTAVVGLWLLMSLLIMRRAFGSARAALQTLSIAYLPALACEGLLIALAREPQLPQPFPYTRPWGLALLGLVVAGYLCVWLNGRVHSPRGWLASLIERVQRAASARAARRDSPARRQARGRLAADWFRAHWGLLLVMALAVPMICYDYNYEPLWQDPLTSYYAARGIMAHGLPFMPSGFVYAKAELYSYVLALGMFIFGQQNGAMRLPSIIECLLTLPLFYGVACSMFQRRAALLATAMLAFSPYTLRWATEARMYQQAQLMVVVVIYLFYKALQARRRPRYVYLAVVALLAMYLSHEETFIVFPGMVLCILLEGWRSRAPGQRLPWMMYSKHWWWAALLAAVGIGLQVMIVAGTHPVVLGTDQSQTPLLHLSTLNVRYYLLLLFQPSAINGAEPFIVLNVVLALAAFLLGIRRNDGRVIYIGLLLITSLLTLALLLSLYSDRYLYPILPTVYLLAAQALLTGLDGLWKYVRVLIARQHFRPGARLTTQEPPFLLMRLLLGFVTTLVCASFLIAPLLPVGNFSIFLSRVTGSSYHRQLNDYDAAAQYVHEHWRPGDVVIAVAPAITVNYYVGHLDYFFSLDRALYLFEKNGDVTDTPTGTKPLFNMDDFRAVLNTHSRVWVISDNGGYQHQLNRERNFVYPPDFHLVFEGYGSAVYFRGN
jgi:uncharacterized membrane protein